MAASHWRSFIGTTITGILVAGAGYYFFSARPQDPVAGIEITYRKQEVPTGFFSDLIQHVNKSNGVDNLLDVAKNYFEYSTQLSIVTYEIHNQSHRNLNNLTFTTLPSSSLVSGFVTDQTGNKIIHDSDKAINISVLPGQEATVSLLLKGQVFLEPGQFTIQDTGVDVRELEDPFPDPLTGFARTYPFLNFMLVVIGAVTSAVLSLTLTVGVFLRFKPYQVAMWTSSDTHGANLALLNLVRVENPAKYAKAVASAEKTFRKWSKEPTELPEDDQA